MKPFVEIKYQINTVTISNLSKVMRPVCLWPATHRRDTGCLRNGQITLHNFLQPAIHACGIGYIHIQALMYFCTLLLALLNVHNYWLTHFVTELKPSCDNLKKQMAHCHHLRCRNNMAFNVKRDISDVSIHDTLVT